MDVIHNIKIPSVHIGSVDPTTDTSLAPSGEGGQPVPITYLTQWKIVGNSEVHGQEIWSCGEYNSTDGKYHILVQPQGGSIADIALDAPLRKINDVADNITFANGSAVVTRFLCDILMSDLEWTSIKNNTGTTYRWKSEEVNNLKRAESITSKCNILSVYYNPETLAKMADSRQGIGVGVSLYNLYCYDDSFNTNDVNGWMNHINGRKVICELETPTTELVDAPQIEEAESYSMAISQGGKAVEWSSFETE